ncbi:MAG: hypothetical protein JXK94_08965 [Deltaproteobacteria bacterium]|nr:hypothetical protein [Deltaproteobacteria bacterium]
MSDSTIQPKGEDLRKAVRWISDQGTWDYKRIEEASQRFNLSPKDQEFLIHFFLKSKSIG